MKIKTIIFLALAIAAGTGIASVFALERNHHGKAKADTSRG